MNNPEPSTAFRAVDMLVSQVEFGNGLPGNSKTDGLAVLVSDVHQTLYDLVNEGSAIFEAGNDTPEALTGFERRFVTRFSRFADRARELGSGLPLPAKT